MPVTGGDRVAAKLRAIPDLVRQRVIEAIEESAGFVLQDAKLLTPRDAVNPGAHAADGLTTIFDKGGMRALVGLPTPELRNNYFWFRFLNGGTEGGQISYRKGGKRFTMNVPSRPALRVLERARDGNLAAIEASVREAVAEGLRG